MKTPEWYKQKIKDVRRRKREMTQTEDGCLYDGKVMDSRKRKQIKDDLKREKRGAKRGEKFDMKRSVNDEIHEWKLYREK